MKNKKSAFILSLICAIASFVVLIINWNNSEKWRFKYSLIGFIIFFIIFLAGTYVTLFRNKNRK